MKSRPPANKSLDISQTSNTLASLPIVELCLLPLLVLTVFSFTLYTSPTSPLTTALLLAKQIPWKSTVHQKLAQLYITMGDFPTARREIDLAQTRDISDVLGTTSDISQIKDTLEGKALAQKQEFWNKVVKDHPNYRDAWVQLLYLSYNAGNLPDAKKYFEKIATLDPNFISSLPPVLTALRTSPN